MAEDKKTTINNPEGVSEAEIKEFRAHLGMHDPQDEEEPLFGKMEQVLDKFSDIDTQDLLNALNSLSDDDESDTDNK